MTRKELELKLLDMTEEMYKMAKDVDPELCALSISAADGHISISGFKDGIDCTLKDVFGTYSVCATKFYNGEIWDSQKYADDCSKEETA